MALRLTQKGYEQQMDRLAREKPLPKFAFENRQLGALAGASLNVIGAPALAAALYPHLKSRVKPVKGKR
jgi:hypothetical protein